MHRIYNKIIIIITIITILLQKYSTVYIGLVLEDAGLHCTRLHISLGINLFN